MKEGMGKMREYSSEVGDGGSGSSGSSGSGSSGKRRSMGEEGGGEKMGIEVENVGFVDSIIIADSGVVGGQVDEKDDRFENLFSSFSQFYKRNNNSTIATTNNGGLHPAFSFDRNGNKKRQNDDDHDDDDDDSSSFCDTGNNNNDIHNCEHNDNNIDVNNGEKQEKRRKTHQQQQQQKQRYYGSSSRSSYTDFLQGKFDERDVYVTFWVTGIMHEMSNLSEKLKLLQRMLHVPYFFSQDLVYSYKILCFYFFIIVNIVYYLLFIFLCFF